MQIERYQYGELRRSLIRGYYREYYTEYSTFFQRNFAWPVALFAVITVVLGALQVGLQTRPLERDDDFQKGCYTFVVFSLMMLVVLLIGGGVLFVALVIYNLMVTLRPKGPPNIRHPNTLKTQV